MLTLSVTLILVLTKREQYVGIDVVEREQGLRMEKVCLAS